jgi:hypothetical protein
MGDKLKDTESITQHLLMELLKMGYRVECNRSAKSADSWYIKICVGTREQPRAVHLRISDHNVVPRYMKSVRYDFDIWGSHWRRNAVTYRGFLSRFALQYGATFSHEGGNSLFGSHAYHSYTGSSRRRETA